MGNCLVTKLKEVVNNDNLLFVGEVIFEVKSGGRFVAGGISDPSRCRAIYGSYTLDSYGYLVVEENQTPAKIGIKYSYDNPYVELSGSWDSYEISLDLDAFLKFRHPSCLALTLVNMSNYFLGDYDLSSLDIFSLNYVSMKPVSIDDLLTISTRINRFEYANTNISGELATLFNKLASEGKNSTLQVKTNGITTLNGVPTTNDSVFNVAFSNGSWNVV